MLLVFGGSLGAGKINQAMIEVIKKYNSVEDVKVFFATGKSYYEPIMTELTDKQIVIRKNIYISASILKICKFTWRRRISWCQEAEL